MNFTHDELLEQLPRLKKLARIMTNHQEVDDLVQATIERAIKNSHLFDPGSNLIYWLSSIMRNIRNDNARSAYSRKSVLTDTIPETAIDAPQEHHIALLQAIDKLKDNSLLLASAYGYSGIELANMHNITKGAAIKKVFNERKKLKGMIEE